ncbi:MAG: hypothetical protein A2202_03155 [Bdellovibrionales bacterium RIFOXYA1_FULL_36_14]|nr:MAG: hypothetical protein A2202_03155 [Bdellovibrionales bacterium RIFOXYA1_FULL_36_14]
MEYLEYILKTFSSIFIIMGPFSIVPVFISLTKDNTEEEKNKMIKKTGLTVMGICLFFALFGNGFFNLFGFSIHSFKVAGGLLLLIMSIEMLHAKRSQIRQTEHEEQEGIEKQDVSIFPLAIPMISGPGAISTVVLQAGEVDSMIKGTILFFAIVISTILMCLILKTAHYLIQILGRTGINIITRLMGLILAAISVEYIIQGIKTSFLLQ